MYQSTECSGFNYEVNERIAARKAKHKKKHAAEHAERRAKNAATKKRLAEEVEQDKHPTKKNDSGKIFFSCVSRYCCFL